jgi:teichuronic acid biosynthesis glycosyltransferase TuaC
MHDAAPAQPCPGGNNVPTEPIRVLMITSEYPSAERPAAVPFIVRQEQYLRKKGVDVDLFAFSGKKRFFNYAKAWLDLRRFTQGKRYDLVHAQWGHSAALALPKRLPWVITFRGNDLEGIVGTGGRYTFKGRVLTTVAKTMAAKADERIVVSESLGRRLGELPFTVIPSGLDLETFRPLPQAESRKMLGLPAGKSLVLFAASTIENQRKRYNLAQEAVDLLKNKHDTELVVANKVHHTQIPVYMAACDALLLTSRHEGSPNVVKEALACNLPVVSVDVGDVRPRIESIAGCALCVDESPEAIAAALERVLRVPTRIDGRRHIKELDENNITEQVIGVYRRALANFSRRSQIKNGGDRER